MQGVFVTLNGTVSTQRDLTAPGEGGTNPVLAWNGSRFALAHEVQFVDIGFPPFPVSREVHVVPLDSAGMQVGGEISIIGDDAYAPRIATSGREFLVVTQRSGAVRGTWLDASARSLNATFLADPSPIAVLDAVSWTGDS